MILSTASSIDTLVKAALILAFLAATALCEENIMNYDEAALEKMDMASFLELLLSTKYYDKRVRPYYFNESCEFIAFLFKRFIQHKAE